MVTSTTKRTTPPAKAATGAKPGTKPGTKPSGTPDKMTAKPATRAKTPVVATPGVVNVKDVVVTEPDLKKKELIDLVVARSSIKKKDAKPVVEAMLAVLGETIASGRELNLQPLGKLRINRTTDKGNGRVIVCKLRQSNAQPGAARDAPAVSSPSDKPKESLAATRDKL